MFNDLPFTLIFVICGVVGVVYENSKKIKMIVADTALLRFYRGIVQLARVCTSIS